MDKFSAFMISSDMSMFAEYEALYRNLYVKILLIIGMPITALYSFYHFNNSRPLESTLVFVMFLSLCCLLYDFIKNSERHRFNLFREITIRVFLLFFIISQLHDIYIDHSLSSTPWFMIFPLLIFFSIHIKEALIWSACIGGLFFFTLFFTDLGFNPDEIFQLKTRLVLIFGILAIIALIISVAIRSAMQELFDNAKAMQTLNLKLEKEIEKHKRAEEILGKSEEKFRLLTENANDIIWTMDMDLNYNYISPAIEKIQGWNSEEAASLTINDVLTPPSMETALKRIELALAHGAKTGNYDTSERLVLELFRKDGTTIWTEISASFILGEDGKPVGILGVTRDITERKILEDQLFQARKMESVGTLAGGIAHDFNNLLMGIQGRASLMALDISPSSEQFEHIEAIREYVLSATGLTKQLLGFARGGKYDVKPIDINELMLATAELFGRTRKQLRIRTKTDPSQPVVEADKSQIEQVLLNLLVNAWQAMPGGGTLSLETGLVNFDDAASKSHRIDAGRYVKLMVTDTGIGMDKSTQQKSFDPFFTTKEKGRGTGMGLASAYGIIKNHGGLITVESEVGHGTTFSIYLPASEKKVAKEIVSNEEVQQGSGTILLVDDEKMILDVGAAMVSKLGYKVLLANSGKEAIETIANPNKNIDLVILDLIMPDMDGGQTLDQIREIRPQLPVMLSSGYALDGQASEIMSKGCNGFIQKPFNLSELSKNIRKLLDSA